jgi:uncharacterized protein (TIGR02099 family)
VSGLIRKAWRIAAGAFAVVVILLAVLVGLARLALVQVPEYRGQIETWAGEALGWPVAIGAMDARLGLRGPELRFTNARVLTRDRQGTLVVAATGHMQFDSLALLRGQLRPGAVSLAGVSLRIERNEERRWRLLGEEGPAFGAGAPVPDEAGSDLPRLADLPAGRLRLEDVRVEFEDAYRALGPWEFLVDALELQLGGGQLELVVAGSLPEALGGKLALSGRITAQDERGRPRDWSAGVSFTALDLEAVGAAVGRPQRVPATGIVDGNLSAEADGAGLARVAGDVLARDLRLPQAPADRAPESHTPYDHLGAGFEWVRTAAGWHARVTDLDVERDGRRWVSPTAAIMFDSDPAVRRIEARAERVELADLTPLARWLPPAARTIAGQVAPSGTVRELEAHLDLPVDQERSPDIYVGARFEALSLDAYERWPAIRNVSGKISGDLYRGSVALDTRAAEVALPWMFRAPIELAAAEAAIDWVRDEEQTRLHTPRFALVNDDASATGAATLTIPSDGSSPQLELEAVLRDIRLAAAPRYLPVNKTPERVVAWLDRALRGGRVDEARLALHGATRKFPYRDGEGGFKAEFEVVEGELDFDPGWPDVTGLDAAVRFENEGLWVDVRSARLLDIAAGPARAVIPDLARGMLAITGEASGSLAEFREFVLAAKQLGNALGAGLAPAEFSAGRASAELDLSLPLRALADYRARVELRITDGVASYGFLGAPLSDLDARLSIDNAQVTARDVSATLAGWPVGADVLVGEDGAVRVEARGRLDAVALARVLRAPLDSLVTGEGDWAGTLRFPAPGAPAPLRLEISSLLEGFASDLPEPLHKRADETRSLRVRAEFPDSELMDFEFEWEDTLQVSARIDRSGPEPVFAAVPGAIEGEPTGLVFRGTIDQLDLGAWLGIELPGEARGGALTEVIAGGRLLVGEVSAPLISLEDALLELSRGDDRWRLEIAANRALGSVEVPFNLYGDEPVVVRLDQLWLGGAAAAGPDAAPVVLHPAKVPALDIEIEDVHWGTVRVGSVSARVLHEADGIELIGLEAIGRGFILQAEGRSRLSESIDESRLGLRINSDDVGATLEFTGFRRGMDASEGRFEADVSWRGGLRSDWLAAIEGEASIMIRDGKLVGVEPGAGRVFGLLSIQALPRRLALDFKDVFGEGTSFDRITGDFRFADGHAFSENLLMRGPAADMVVVGRTGIVARDYDQTAVIAADLGRTLPVAGAVVAGPAVGAALYLLSEMLRKPFQTQVTYRLTGPWENPVIEKLAAGSTSPRGEPPAAAPQEVPAQDAVEGEE